MQTLKGKTVFIAVADSVVGRACARVLSMRGANICLAAANEDDAQRVAKELNGAPFSCVSLDVKDETSWQKAFAASVATHGALDIFVQCVGRYHGGSPIVETSLADFKDAIYDTGVAAWLGQKQAILTMRAGGAGGGIIHVTSLLGRDAIPNAAATCAASSGIVMSSKAAALECAKNKDKIVVNTVLAGPVDGDNGEHYPPVEDCLAGSLVSADDVAEAVLFYATDGAAYMTGTELPVEGGMLCQ